MADVSEQESGALPYHRIALEVSDAAAVALTTDIQQMSFDAVVAVMWTRDPYSGREFWEVAFYCRSDVPIEGIQEIRRVPFVLNQGSLSAKLNGMILDRNDGEYKVISPK